MKHLDPDHVGQTVNGAFELDAKGVEQLVAAMRGMMPENFRNSAELELSLKFRNGRKTVSNSLSDLETFPFHDRGRETFEVSVREPRGPRLAVQFNFGVIQSIRAWVWVADHPRILQIKADLTATIKSCQTWYGLFTPMKLWFALLLSPSALQLVDFIIRSQSRYELLLATKIGVPALLATLLLVRAFLYDPIAMDIGAEGRRLREKKRFRVWIPNAAFLIFLAVVGSGVLK